MIAKIVKGKSFRGVVNYVLDKKKGTEPLHAEGLRLKEAESIIKSFNSQVELNKRITKPVYHISLDFSVKDKARLTNDLMVEIAQTYMAKMNMEQTQYLIARHYDKEHPHIHLIINRVDFNGKTISDKNDRIRSEGICKKLTREYQLYFAKGKEQVKIHRLKGADKTKYEIYEALKQSIPRCKNWKELEHRLSEKGITIHYKYKGQTDEVQGVSFRKDELSFNGSKVDRQFSYSKINYQLYCNAHKASQSFSEKLDSKTFSALRIGAELLNPDYLHSSHEQQNKIKKQNRFKNKKRRFGPRL
ncbi:MULTISPECIES: relaxase/mobilization nuclease domain-containing protein [unclassified Carboxylicivirga]|uniref:relaxase/mobilization nuclease domain-containing protein n=1 Tax=Carboxylicivirga TaxID=1628153 RepID=UPI003D355333